MPNREMTPSEVALFEQGFAAHADGVAHDQVPAGIDRLWWLRGWFAACDDNRCIYGRCDHAPNPLAAPEHERSGSA